MAYYDALITKWATLAPGTTAEKLAQINAITVSGTIPATIFVNGNQILNCINWPEFNALTAAQQSNILLMCSTQGQLLGGSANLSHIVPGMIVAYFPGGGSTITALSALSAATVQPWWQANGYSSRISNSDLAAAGGLT
jgi:hypothetical protein